MKKTCIKFLQIFKIIIKSLFHYKAITFAFLTVATFLSFLAFFYILYGNKFLYEYFFYHLVRKDHRHNYSIFYYLIYLTYTSSLSKLLSLLTFAPQVILILLSTLFLFQNINLCLIVLTMVFVTFNKVVTAQYFLWYICLIPLIVPNNKLFDYNKHPGKVIWGVVMFIVWLFFELIWNSYSHRLEYRGENLFLEIWIINCIFFFVNSVIIKELIVNEKSFAEKKRNFNFLENENQEEAKIN
jgi:phosphatidylinositol glycan class M